MSDPNIHFGIRMPTGAPGEYSRPCAVCGCQVYLTDPPREDFEIMCLKCGAAAGIPDAISACAIAECDHASEPQLMILILQHGCSGRFGLGGKTVCCGCARVIKQDHVKSFVKMVLPQLTDPFSIAWIRGVDLRRMYETHRQPATWITFGRRVNG